MAVDLKKLISGIIIVLAVFSGVVIKWQFDKDLNTLYRDGVIIAKEKWVVESERTYFNLISWYDINVKCPKIEALGGYRTTTRCYYPTNYYEQLSRSLINTKIDYTNTSDYFSVFKEVPFYKYGTTGSYAGKLLEGFKFKKQTTNVEEFPEKYWIGWSPQDTRNYRLIWRVENLKGITLSEGNYTDCYYKFGYVKIDLKNECNKLERAELKDNRIWFYFKPVRYDQRFDLSLVDPLGDDVTLFLDGLNESRKYEFETTVNISANCTNCIVCINLTAPNTGGNISCGVNYTNYPYYINLLRLSEEQFDYTNLSNIIEEDTGNEFSCSETLDPSYPCSNTNDGDLDTYGESQTLNWNYTVFENYTIPSNIMNAYWTLKYRVSWRINSTCWDGSKYIEIFSAYGGGTTTATNPIPSNCLNGSKFQTNTTILKEGGGIFSLRYYEGKVGWNYTGNSELKVEMDNKTEMIKTNLNITNHGTSSNINISYYGIIKKFRGDLLTQYLIQDDFIYLGEFETAVNLTYSAAGSKYIFTNLTDKTNNVSFDVSAFDIDADNEFSETEDFDYSAIINSTLTTVDAPLGIFDDFILNITDRWEITKESGSVTPSFGYSSGSLSGSSSGATACTTQNSVWRIDYDDEAADLRNTSIIETDISLSSNCYRPVNAECSSSAFTVLYATDGTNIVTLISYTTSCSGSGSQSAGGSNLNITLIKAAKDYKTWTVYVDGVSQGNKDLSSLDFTKQIKLRGSGQSYAGGSCSGPACTTSASVGLHRIKWGGVWLNYSTTNGTYKSSGNFTSGIIYETLSNVSRATLTCTKYQPSETNIDLYMSQDGGETFEAVTSGVTHAFTSSFGNQSVYRAVINSSINITSPHLDKCTYEVISASIKNLTVDLDDDGVVDWQLNGTLNSSNSPKRVNFTTLPIGYTTIRISSTAGGLLQINEWVKNTSMNPIELNNASFEDCSTCSITFDYSGDDITIDGLEFDFYGDWNYTATAYSGSVTNSHVINIKYSKINISIVPPNIDYWDLGPNLYSYEQTYVVPFGNENGNGNPFFAADKKVWNHSVDIYIRYNESVNSCATTWFQGKNVTNNSNFNTTLTASSKILIQNITQIDKSINVSTWTNISCGAYNSSMIIPYFCFKSFCSECVKTSDWDEGCDYLE